MSFKEGDLVTVHLDSSNPSSNVYKVVKNLGEECLLNHPLYPECYILKPTEQLNYDVPKMKSPIENCLSFVMKHKNYLDFNTIADVESICAYFIINKRLTPKQKKTISILCGKIASIKLEDNIAAAIKTVSENAGILDDFNEIWYNNLKDVFSGKKVPTPRQRDSIFNIAGFVLAQLEVNKVAQPGGGINELDSEIPDSGREPSGQDS